MGYLYKTVRLQALRFMAVGLIASLLFVPVAIFLSPAIIYKFIEAPAINISTVVLKDPSAFSVFSRNYLRPYTMESMADATFKEVKTIKGTQYVTVHFDSGDILLMRADATEKLTADKHMATYIQPIDFIALSKKTEKAIQKVLTQLHDQKVEVNTQWMITTTEKSDLAGFATFVAVLSLLPILFLRYGCKEFFGPRRNRELKYHQKFYYEDIVALSKDFDVAIKNKTAVRLKKADIFRDFIVVKEAFRYYIIPLESLAMLYPTRKFIFHSLLWFMPKIGLAVYEEERAYFVRLPRKTVAKIVEHIRNNYPYIDQKDDQNHPKKRGLKHAMNPEAVWQDLLKRKAQHQQDKYYV